jgi:hypothetical protein
MLDIGIVFIARRVCSAKMAKQSREKGMFCKNYFYLLTFVHLKGYSIERPLEKGGHWATCMEDCYDPIMYSTIR